MRKTFIQCCLALLMVPVLVFMLIGTIALAVDSPRDTGSGTSTSSGSGGGSSSNPGGSGGGSSSNPSGSGGGSSSNPGGSGGGSGTPTVESISATFGSGPVEVQIGKTAALSPTKVVATMSGGGGTQDITGNYTLSATGGNGIATFSSSGTSGSVYGAAIGTTTLSVTVTYQGKTDTKSVTVNVVAVPVTGLTITDPRPDVSGKVSMTAGETKRCTVSVTPADTVLTWTSSDRDVAVVESGNIKAYSPGEAVLTVRAGDKEDSIKVEVGGFKLKGKEFTVAEHGAIALDDILERFGGVSYSDLNIYSNNIHVATYVESQGIVGNNVGTATISFTAKSGKGSFTGSITVTVKPDPTSTIDRRSRPLKVTDTLSFNTLYSDFRSQAGGTLDRVIGLNVDTKQGTLYYKYQSEAVTNQGVGSEAYYLNPSVGQRGISDITFVPKRNFTGGEVTINYTAVSTGGENYACKILLTVDPGTGASAGISLSTDYNTPVKFSGSEFNQVCKSETGVDLDYVVFTLPPVRQGTLYTNYVREGNYGSVVSSTTRYTRSELDNVWFVPAPGFEGTVNIYYTAHGKQSASNTFTGVLTVKVGRDNSVAIGGLSYDVAVGGVARFDDDDFNQYCHSALNDPDMEDRNRELSFIRFTSLPSASQGVLWYDYRTASNTGSRAAADTSYYCGSRAPRIDRLVFVPAEGFIGTIKIPFSGWSIDGVQISGNVEINVRGGVGTGDIYYACAPGRSVSFINSDFTSLSTRLTGYTLNYIKFQSLPSTTEGSLYYNNRRIDSTGTRYGNNSGNRISNLSFRASSTFSGTVNIPFEGVDRNGGTFYGVITIGSEGSGTGSGNIRYTANAKSAAVFERDDFDAISWEETREYVNTVRFKLPNASQGTLYRGYRSSSNMGTRITTSNYSVAASALDQVAFVPASGYTGTVYLEYTATALNSGGTFDGTVEIEVGRAPADVTVSYSTRNTTPVNFYGSDFGRSGYTLSSIKFDSLPASGAGYLYYQYSSPTRYGQLASTGTAYRLSGGSLISNLTFVPRAGYTGTVSIPYTGTNSNNSTFTGEVLITVSPSYSSSYFSDMGGYSDAQRAAVDFLYDHNITRGLTSTQYGPEASIRRGDFARMIYQAFELTPTSSTGVFRDVPGSAYYAEAVNALYARGIVSGIGDGYYAPDSTLTRQDAICMVQRAMRAVGWNANDGYSSALYGYSDGGSVSGYAQGAMAFAVQRGYLPTSGGQLNPTLALTRVDMAEIIHRVLTY